MADRTPTYYQIGRTRPYHYGGYNPNPSRLYSPKPSRLFQHVQSEMEDMIDRLQRSWSEDDPHDQNADDGRQPVGGDGGEDDFSRSLNQWAQSPQVDFEDDEAAYFISVEMPGTKAEDLNVEISENVLRISGEKRQRREDKSSDRSVRERRYGRFERTIRLPKNINEDEIEASFEDGVLDIMIPKSETAIRSRKIEVSSSSASANPRVAQEGERSASPGNGNNGASSSSGTTNTTTSTPPSSHA